MQERIDDEKIKYHSSLYECQCSGNRLLSCILGVDVPCIHRISYGAHFPDPPIINLSSNLQWNELIVEPFPLEEEKYQEEISLEKIDLKYIIEMIHKYCKCKKREKIEEYSSI